MGAPVKPVSLGYLKGIFDDQELNDLSVTEYRDSIESTVTVSGPNVEDRKDKIKDAFLLWYPPNGYASRTSNSNSPTRGFVLTLTRYLNCD